MPTTETNTTSNVSLHAPDGTLNILGRLASHITALDTILPDHDVPQAEKVHAARVTLKRFRAYWRAIDSKLSRKQLKILRSAARTLAIQRERDVLLETMAGLHHEIPADELVACHIALTRFYESSKKTTPTDASLGSALTTLQKTLDVAAANSAESGQLADHLPALFKRCRKALRKCREATKRSAWHTLRCRLKDFQYVLELTCEPMPGTLAPLHKKIKKLASVLGDANDFQLLRKRMEQLETHLKSGPAKTMRRACRKQAKLLMSDACALCDDFLAKEYGYWKKTVQSCVENQSISCDAQILL